MSKLHLNVQRLRVYIDSYYDIDRSLLTNSWQTITHLRINGKPSLQELTNIRALQFRLALQDISQILEELKTNVVILRHLEGLEFSDYQSNYTQRMTIQALINEWESDGMGS